MSYGGNSFDPKPSTLFWYKTWFSNNLYHFLIGHEEGMAEAMSIEIEIGSAVADLSYSQSPVADAASKRHFLAGFLAAIYNDETINPIHTWLKTNG